MVRRGVCMHGGRVLVAGSVWGEDVFADLKGGMPVALEGSDPSNSQGGFLGYFVRKP